MSVFGCLYKQQPENTMWLYICTRIVSDSSPKAFKSSLLMWSKFDFTLRATQPYRVLSTGGGSFPPKRLSFPQKILLKKNLQLFQTEIIFDDDFKESLKGY